MWLLLCWILEFFGELSGPWLVNLNEYFMKNLICLWSIGSNRCDNVDRSWIRINSKPIIGFGITSSDWKTGHYHVIAKLRFLGKTHSDSRLFPNDNRLHWCKFWKLNSWQSIVARGQTIVMLSNMILGLEGWVTISCHCISFGKFSIWTMTCFDVLPHKFLTMYPNDVPIEVLGS